MGRSGLDRDLGLLLLRLAIGGVFTHFGAVALLAGPPRWSRLGAAARLPELAFFPELGGLLLALGALAGGIGLLLALWFRPFCLLLTAALAIAAWGSWAHSGAAAVEALARVLLIAGLFFTGAGRYGLGR